MVQCRCLEKLWAAIILCSVLPVSGVGGTGCSSKMVMDALARVTVAASGVFEGRLEDVNFTSVATAPVRLPADQFNATFSFKRSFKGNFKQFTKATSRPTVVVGFLNSGQFNDCLEVGSRDFLKGLLTHYIVFVSRKSFVIKKTADGQPASIFYQMSTFPQLSTKPAVEQVRAYGCSKCGNIKVKLSPGHTKRKLGQNVVLDCRLNGRPAERFDWFKDRQPLVMSKRVNATVGKKGSSLRINNVTLDDVGAYQCRAINAISNTSLVSATLQIEKNAAGVGNGNKADNIHGVPCPNQAQEYCMHGGTCMLVPALGSRYCTCIDDFHGDRCQERRPPPFRKVIPTPGVCRLTNCGFRCLPAFSGYRCAYHNNSHVYLRFNPTFENFEASYIVSGIAIVTLILAATLVICFCAVRSYCEMKRRRRTLRRNNSDYRPPSLPDGHAVNVVQLNAEISSRAAALALSAAREGGPSPPIMPPFSHLRQNPTSSSDYELPRLRRDMQRASSSSMHNAARCSSQVLRLSMLSTASSQLGRGYRLPAISATPDSDLQDAAQLNADSDRLAEDGERGAAVAGVGRGEELEMLEIAHNAAPSGAVSLHSSQCSHTESLNCDSNTAATTTFSGNDISAIAAATDTAPNYGTDPPHPRGTSSTDTTLPLPDNSSRRCPIDTIVAAAVDSDISEQFDDPVDLEVNFESEADMRGVETSGDELDRIGRSHDYSELSSQLTTERGSSDDGDDDDGSGSDDPFSRRLLGYGAVSALVGNSSGDDLSWDESADLPSFVAPVATAVVVPAQFGKR